MAAFASLILSIQHTALLQHSTHWAAQYFFTHLLHLVVAVEPGIDHGGGWYTVGQFWPQQGDGSCVEFTCNMQDAVSTTNILCIKITFM